MKKFDVKKLIFLVEAELFKHRIVSDGTGSGGYGNYAHSHRIESTTLMDKLSKSQILQIERLIEDHLSDHKDVYDLLIFIPYFVSLLSRKYEKKSIHSIFRKAYNSFFKNDKNIAKRAYQSKLINN